MDPCLSHGDVRILSEHEIAIRVTAEGSQDALTLRVHYGPRKVFRDYGDYISDIDAVRLDGASKPLRFDGETYRCYLADIDGDGTKDRVVIYGGPEAIQMAFGHRPPPRA